MFIVHIHVRVKEGQEDAFRQATIENARESMKEPGVEYIEVLQHMEDSTRFVLVEAYKSPEASAKRKETNAYQAWRDRVVKMMAEPRASARYLNVFPGDIEWKDGFRPYPKAI